MSFGEKCFVGDVLWQDLSVENASEVRDFYRKIIGWDFLPEDMGGYEDYHMVISSTGDSVARIYHARGENADLPPVWLIYFIVEDVDGSAQICKESGGEVIVQPRYMGEGRFCVIRDPAGAICTLYRPPNSK